MATPLYLVKKFLVECGLHLAIEGLGKVEPREKFQRFHISEGREGEKQRGERREGGKIVIRGCSLSQMLGHKFSMHGTFEAKMGLN